MRLVPKFLGRRLLFRLYGYQALLFVSMALAVTVGRSYLLAPAMDSERGAAFALLAEPALRARDEPSVLRERIANLRERGFRITVFAADGTVMASSEARPPEPLEAGERAELEHREWTRSKGAVAVREADSPSVPAYAIVRWSESTPVLLRISFPIVILLSAIGLGSIPFARAIAKPLEQLERVTRDFGLGDLRVRADTNRHDEIGHLARTFNQMTERVEGLRRAEKELLANVSHELRTPLARIRVVLELAAEEAGDVTQRYLADISEDLTELEQILGDIIATARLDLANERAADPYPPLRLTPVHVGSIVETLGQRLRESNPSRALRYAVDHALRVNADRVMLKRAVGNVLDNAHKYSPEDRSIDLSVESTADGKAAAIAIRDYGQGIADEDLPRVFEPFFRADRSRTRLTGGTGLGLALAKRIVEAHGGAVSIRSARGVGTTVTLTFPTEPDVS